MHSRHLTTPGRRVLLLVVGALVLGALSIALDAATARAATIGPQEAARAPQRFPYDLPGGYRRHRVIPAGYVLLSRRVRMTPAEGWRRVAFTCPAGARALSPGFDDPSEITFRVDPAQYRGRHRRFALDVRPAPPTIVRGRFASGRVFLVCGPRPLR